MAKKGVSPVIAAVMMILITIAAVSIIAGVIVPFVKNSLESGKVCYEATGSVEINADSGVTCFNSLSEASVTIQRSPKEFALDGFLVSIIGSGESRAYEVIDGAIEGDIKMYGGNYSSALVLPEAGESRTYTFNTTGLAGIEQVQIAPIVAGGETCDVVDNANILSC